MTPKLQRLKEWNKIKEEQKRGEEAYKAKMRRWGFMK